MIWAIVEYGGLGAVIGIIAAILLGDLFKPDDFAGDWYGWITNQGAHIMSTLLPLILIVATTATWWEVPTRAFLGFNFFAFAASFQAVQWWRGGTFADSVQDAAFMSYGGLFPAVLFRVGDDNSPKIISVKWLLAAALWVTAHWLIGSWVRRK